MLQVKSQYKIAKRLGAAVFEKTQSQKFALSDARVKKTKKPCRGGGSDYGRQLLEKQKVRFTYGLSEKQLSKYAAKSFAQPNPSDALHKELEMRADMASYQAGLASTRRAGRQMVSHGHITVNGRRITTPSYRVKIGVVIAVREGSRKSQLFASLVDENKENRRAVPQWITTDIQLLKAEITGEPTYVAAESGLDYATLFEFYSR